MWGRFAVLGLAGLTLACGGAQKPSPPAAASPSLAPEPASRSLAGARLVEPAGHMASVHCLSFSPDGRQLLSGSEDGSLLVWDVATGEVVQRLEKHEGFVRACAFLPDGRHAVSGGWSGEVFVWEVSTAKAIRLPGLSRAHAVYSLGVRADGREIAVGTYYGEVHGWELATGRETFSRTLWEQGQSRVVWAVQAVATGGWLASGDQGTVRLNENPDVAGEVWAGEVTVSTLALGDGQIAVGRGDGVHLLKGPGSDALLGRHDTGVCALAATPQGDAVLAGDDHGVARLWNLEKGSVRCEIELPAGIRAAAIDPQGRHVALASDDSTVRLYALETCSPEATPQAIHELEPRRSRTSALALGSEELVVGDGAGRLSLWSTAERRMRMSQTAHGGEVTALAALGANQWATARMDRRVLLHSPEGTGEPGATELGALPNIAWALEPLQGGSVLLAGDRSGYLTRFDLESGEQRVVLAAGGPIIALAEVPTTGQVLVGGAFAGLLRYDPAQNARLPGWSGGFADARSTDARESTCHLVVAPGGDTFAQGGTDGSLLVRSTEQDEVLRHLEGLETEVNGLVFTESTTLWGGDSSGALVRWDLDQPSSTPAFRTSLGSPILQLAADSEGARLYAALADGRVLELGLPGAELQATLIGLRDGSWATVYPDGRSESEGEMAQGLEFELPGRRVVTLAGTSRPPRFSAPQADRLQPGLVRVRSTVFSPGGMPEVELDDGWKLASLEPSRTVQSAYELEFFLGEGGRRTHRLTVKDPSGQRANVAFSVLPSADRGGEGSRPGGARRVEAAPGAKMAPAWQALLIGNSRYASEQDLEGVEDDVRGMERLLTREPRGLRLPSDAVRSLHDLSAAELRESVQAFFAAAGPEQTLLFYYSGHGASVGGQGYLLPVDAAPGHVEEALSAEELWSYLEASPAGRIVVILDACRSGAFLVPPALKSAVNQSERVLLLTATTPSRAALDTARGGAYTRALLAAVRKRDAVDPDLGGATLWRVHHLAALDMGDQGPLLMGAPSVGRLVLATPELETVKLALLEASQGPRDRASVVFRGAPEISRERQVALEALGPGNLFGKGKDRTLQFKVYVGHATKGLRASVVAAVSGATPRPVRIEAPVPANSEQRFKLPLQGLAPGHYELLVEPCSDGGNTCSRGAKARFELD